MEMGGVEKTVMGWWNTLTGVRLNGESEDVERTGMR